MYTYDSVNKHIPVYLSPELSTTRMLRGPTCEATQHRSQICFCRHGELKRGSGFKVYRVWVCDRLTAYGIVHVWDSCIIAQ